MVETPRLERWANRYKREKILDSTRSVRRRRSAGLMAAAVAVGAIGFVGQASASETGYSCISPLSQWYPGESGAAQGDGLGSKDHELIDFLKLKLERDGQPLVQSGTNKVELNDTSLTVEIDDQAFLKRLWVGHGGKPMIPDVGTTTWPLWVWVAIQGSNTQEGVQVVKARASYDFTVWDPTPGNFRQAGPFFSTNNDPAAQPLSTALGQLVSPNHPAALIPNTAARASGDEIFQPIKATVRLPKSVWTPNGGGQVSFSLAPPGNLGVAQSDLEKLRYEGVAPAANNGVIEVLGRYAGRGRTVVNGQNLPGDANRWHRVRPFGSVYVRAETFIYGMSNDCVKGDIALTQAGQDGTIPASDPGTGGYFAGQNSGQRRYFWGNGSATGPNHDLGPADSVGPPAGSPQSSTGTIERAHAPVGVAGRYAINAAAAPAFASTTTPPPPGPNTEADQLRQQLANAEAATRQAEDQLRRLTTLPARPLSISTRTVKAARNGTVVLRLVNGAEQTVTGRLSARSTAAVRQANGRRVIPVAAAGDVFVLSSRARNVRVALSPQARAGLQRQAQIRTRVTVNVNGAANVNQVVTIRR